MTRIEVAVVIFVVVIVATIFVNLLSNRRHHHGSAKSLKDKTQITQIHRAHVAYSAENNGRHLLPGMATAASESKELDFSQNHTAPFYSHAIAMNLFNPEILVSNVELNPGVRVKDDYNHEAYNATASSFWDTTFEVRIDDPKIGANSSFAHAALCGLRRDVWMGERTGWRNQSPSGMAVFGTRGTRDGTTSGPEYDRSPTLHLYGSKGMWMGHICFADNHVETLTDFSTSSCLYKPAESKKPVRDNFFAAEFPHPHGNQAAADSFLGIFIGSTEWTVDPIYDPLN